MEDLTYKQKEILECVKKFISDHGYPPTVREICKLQNIVSPATIQNHLNKLEEKKYIKRDPKRNRAIEILVNNDNIVSIPLLNNNEFIFVPSFMVDYNKDYYGYIMDYNSCENNIFINDIIIIEKQKNYNIGDIIVYIDNSLVVLEKAKDNHIKKIVGKVSYLYRKIK